MNYETKNIATDAPSELGRKSLVHKSPLMKIEDFMAEIDKTGGWPVGFKYVSFYHSVEYSGRACKFTNVALRTGWWTTVCSADDYYYWKLSGGKKKEIMREARKQLIRWLELRGES